MNSLLDSLSKRTTWSGFVLGLLGGAAVSCLLIGLVLGYSLAGGARGARGVAVEVNKPSDAAPPSQPAPAKSVPPVTDDDHLRGDPNANITVVEYSDFECPFCKRHAPTMAQVLEAYKGKVNVVYRHFPLSFHQNAQKLAEASECAAELGGNDAFWEYHDEIFNSTAANAAKATPERFKDVAKKIGVNDSKFQKCIDSGKHAKKIADQMQGGIEAGVQGTPGNFIVNNDTEETKEVSGAVPFASFQSSIDAMLGK
ncbi:DsbA family protein [Candidatus Peregrinibacteria bacterium]|nr:DsbA family protein [Candidatus Peregrinibacteria bacterium]